MFLPLWPQLPGPARQPNTFFGSSFFGI